MMRGVRGRVDRFAYCIRIRGGRKFCSFARVAVASIIAFPTCSSTPECFGHLADRCCVPGEEIVQRCSRNTPCSMPVRFVLFACRLLRELSEIDRNHFPGRGGVIYVINTPPLFGLVWQGIQGFLATQVRCRAFSILLPTCASYQRARFFRLAVLSFNNFRSPSRPSASVTPRGDYFVLLGICHPLLALLILDRRVRGAFGPCRLSRAPLPSPRFLRPVSCNKGTSLDRTTGFALLCSLALYSLSPKLP